MKNRCFLTKIKLTSFTDFNKKNEKKLREEKKQKIVNWLVVSTHLKNIGQTGNLPQIGMKL